LDDVLQDIGTKVFGAGGLRVLAGDDDGIHANRFPVRVIFDGDLGFAIRPEVGAKAVLANLGETLGEFVRQCDGRWHQLFGLVHGETEHHALIAGATGVDAHGDITGLLVDARDHGTGIRVESVNGIVVTDRLHHTTYQSLEVHIGLGGDFPGDYDE